MYKAFSLVTILCFASLIGSCQSSKSFEQSGNKENYLLGLQSKSAAELQKLLKKDLQYVDTLFDGVRNTQMSYSVGFGMSAGDGKTSKDFDAAKPYELKNLKDSLKPVFEADMKELTMEQKFIYPNSQLQMDYPDKAEGGDVSLTLVKMYSKGVGINPVAVGMKRVDSADVSLSYVFPTAFDRWEINGGDSAMYDGKVAIIEHMKGKEVDFTMPQSLYRMVLSYQAVTKDGKLMDHNSLSAFPVTVVKRRIINEIAATQEILKKASVETNAENARKLLAQLPEGVFESKNQLQKMRAELKQLDKLQSESFAELKKSIEIIKKLIVKYGDVLSPEEQSISLKFPADVAKVYLYMGKSFDSLTASGMARNEEVTQTSYLTYQDSASTKYGIIDGAGNIIIQAEFERPLNLKEGTNYFNTYPNGSYYLDAGKKKLVEIKDKSFVRTLDKTRAVFQDSMDYVGVLENNEQVLLPFEYDKIEQAGNLYAVSKSLRGRSHVEILDNKGKILFKDFKDFIVPPEQNSILFSNKYGQIGLLGTDGKYLIAPQDLILRLIGSGPVFTYSTDGQLEGLVDMSGKKLTSEIYYEIEKESDGLLLVETEGTNLKGYISPKGEVVIVPKYQEANDFNMGLALIREDDGTWHLIDKKGKVVKSIPASAGDFENVNGSGAFTTYIFENQYFDAKGNLAKRQPTD